MLRSFLTRRSRPARLVLALLAVCAASFVTIGPAVAATLPFTMNVTCDNFDIGTITIDVYQPVGDMNNTDGSFGVTIRGGFDVAAPGPNTCPREPGTSYYWVQIYKGLPKLYAWEREDGWNWDRTRVAAAPNETIADGWPFYVNLRGPGYGHDLGLFDEPTDGFATTDHISIDFQTALVCAPTQDFTQNGTNSLGGDIHWIAGFTWGLDWLKVGNQALFTETPLTPNANFADFLDAFNNDPDPAHLSDKWTLEEGCCCVPEIDSALLSALGLVTVALGALRRPA